jgi:hypothetical protein
MTERVPLWDIDDRAPEVDDDEDARPKFDAENTPSEDEE